MNEAEHLRRNRVLHGAVFRSDYDEFKDAYEAYRDGADIDSIKGLPDWVKAVDKVVPMPIKKQGRLR